jgi:hypothetical protein
MLSNDYYVKIVKPTKETTIFIEDFKDYEKFSKNNDVIKINEGTDNEFLLVPISLMGKYKCIILSKDDFKAINRDATNLSDNQLAHIASNVGETLVENYFWDSLEFWADEYQLPYITPEDDDNYIDF